MPTGPAKVSGRMDFEQVLACYPERHCAAQHGIVSYREAGAGTGPALVLLHGISSGAASWIQQLADLAPGLRVIAWDAPGYGTSSPLAIESPLASDYANVLAQLVAALSLESFTLVGHSLGALMAAAYAHAHPQQVEHLVLMSPARGYAMAEQVERERRYTERLAVLERLEPEGLARERAPALLSSTASSEAVAWIAWNMRRLHPGGYRQAAYMLANDDIGRYARGYTKPVTVLSGEADQITPVQRCKAVADQFNTATYTSVPGLGHALYIEDPVQINRFLRDQAMGHREDSTRDMRA